MTAVLITRPKEGAHAYAQHVIARGAVPIFAPLVALEPTNAPPPQDLTSIDGLILTSAAAARTLPAYGEAIRDSLCLKPCVCVGEATAQAAQRVGLTATVLPPESSAGNGAALAHFMISHPKYKTFSWLHLTRADHHQALPMILRDAGVQVWSWFMYRAIPATTLPNALCARFSQGEIDIVTLFSQQTARILVRLLHHHQLSSLCGRVRLCAISQPVAHAAHAITWKDVGVAAEPNLAAMTRLLDGYLR